MKWDGGLFVEIDDKTKQPTVQFEVKKAIESVNDIDIEQLKFILEMVKNLDFDISGGNFIQLNGSIVRDDGLIHHQKKTVKRTYDNPSNASIENMIMLPQAKSTNPIKMDEVFIKTDVGFSYCAIINVSQFLFKQGGYFWLWDSSNRKGNYLHGWTTKPDLQLVFTIHGEAVPPTWFKKWSDEPNWELHDSEYAYFSRPQVRFTQGYSTKKFEEDIMAIPRFEDAFKKGYGVSFKKYLDESLADADAKRLERSKQTYGTPYTYAPMNAEEIKKHIRDVTKRLYSDYFRFYLQGFRSQSVRLDDYKNKEFEGVGIEKTITENYGAPCDIAVSLSKGNITLLKKESYDKPYFTFDSIKGGYGHQNAFKWSRTLAKDWKKNAKPKVIKNWRENNVIFNNDIKIMKDWSEHEDRYETKGLYGVESLPNFSFTFFQYKLSHGILNRMVL